MDKLNAKLNFKSVLLIILSVCVFLLFIIIIFCSYWNEKKAFVFSKKTMEIVDNNGKAIFQRVVAKSICHEATLEYPVTDSKTINETILDHVEDSFVNFAKEISGLSTQCRNKHVVNYEYNPFAESFTSIKLIENTELKNEKKKVISAWTFNSDTGQSLVLSDVFEDIKGINENLLPESSFFVDDDNQIIEVPLESGNELISIEKYALHIKRDSFDGVFRNMFSVNQTENIDCNSEKCIALTYDDGPSIYTEQLLDILRIKKAKASFFVIGNRVHQYSGTVTRVANEGHDVGSHSWSHARLHGRTSTGLSQDIGDTVHAIQVTTGKKVRYFRPPGGEINDILVHELDKAGLQTVLWSIDTNDWRTRSAESTCNAIVDRAAANSIVLMHDIYSFVAEATICVIDRLSNDYVFVSLTDLFN